MHFSTCSNSSVQSPSSTGDFSMRCRVLRPFPQVTLQSLHSDHGVSMQGIVSTPHMSVTVTFLKVVSVTSIRLILHFSPDLMRRRSQNGSWSQPVWDLRHSGIMHFSTSSTSAPQMEPSAGGIFTKRSLLFMPRPQVALQTSHSPHSVTRQLLGAEPAKAESRFSNGALVLTSAPQGSRKTHSTPRWPRSPPSPPSAAYRSSRRPETASRNAHENESPSHRRRCTGTMWSTQTSYRWMHLDPEVRGDISWIFVNLLPPCLFFKCISPHFCFFKTKLKTNTWAPVAYAPSSCPHPS